MSRSIRDVFFNFNPASLRQHSREKIILDRGRLQLLLEISILGALSFVFDKLTVFEMPQGGSITLSMLPIIVMAFRWGLAGGMLTGFISGLLQLITGGKVFHWAQALLDYTLAYTLVGVAAITGIWLVRNIVKKNKGGMAAAIITGTIIGGILRYLIHFIGGIVFFGEYAPEGQPVWLYSLVYNGSYMIPSMILCAIVAVLLFTTAPRLLKRT
ncbi:energy-coupled thiamine transporter ThiT [Sporosarcina sp. Marseille-Q4063]|nr:energy-coupled thiamine transporter ThiT [Sporosarcina sp. Marseille-Q4063]